MQLRCRHVQQTCLPRSSDKVIMVFDIQPPSDKKIMLFLLSKIERHRQLWPNYHFMSTHATLEMKDLQPKIIGS